MCMCTQCVQYQPQREAGFFRHDMKTESLQRPKTNEEKEPNKKPSLFIEHLTERVSLYQDGFKPLSVFSCLIPCVLNEWTAN